jgi:hypothetical protein
MANGPLRGESTTKSGRIGRTCSKTRDLDNAGISEA